MILQAVFALQGRPAFAPDSAQSKIAQRAERNAIVATKSPARTSCAQDVRGIKSDIVDLAQQDYKTRYKMSTLVCAAKSQLPRVDHAPAKTLALKCLGVDKSDLICACITKQHEIDIAALGDHLVSVAFGAQSIVHHHQAVSRAHKLDCALKSRAAALVHPPFAEHIKRARTSLWEPK